MNESGRIRKVLIVLIVAVALVLAAIVGVILSMSGTLGGKGSPDTVVKTAEAPVQTTPGQSAADTGNNAAPVQKTEPAGSGEPSGTTSPVATDASAVPVSTPAEGATPAPTQEPTPAPTEEPTPTPAEVQAKLGCSAAGLGYVPQGKEIYSKARELTIVVNGSLNVRSGPSTDYKSLTVVKTGDAFKAYAAKDSWYLVEYAKGKSGWVSGKYSFGLWMFDTGDNGNLAGLTKPEEEDEKISTVFVLSSDGANVRKGPSTSYAMTDTLKDRTEVVRMASSGDWYLCNYKGVFGWIHDSNFADGPISSVADGTHRFYTATNPKFTKLSDGVYSVPCTIYKYVVFSQKEVDKVRKGTDVKKHGYTLKASEIDKIVDVFYNKSLGGYTVLTEDNAIPNYKVGSATLVLNASTKIEDNGYPIYTDSFTSSEKKTYGFSNDTAYFTGAKKLTDYISVLKKHDSYWGFNGSVTVKNGIVTKFVNDYQE